MDLIQTMKKDIRITEYAQARGFTLVRAGTQYTLREHDSVRIDPEKNLFIRNADRSTAGSIIDFVMWVDGMGQQDAIRKLRGQMRFGDDYLPRPAQMRGAQPRKTLELPTQTTGKFNRVYAYLNKTRGINNTVIAAMMKRKLLYEDDHHNCVFVGFDYDGKAAFASKRSTLTQANYRGDAGGSRKEVGFFVDNHAPALFVTEAPIDAMSIMSMLAYNNRDPTAFNYLALCGVSDKALAYHMSRAENSGINRIYLATDNDPAGNTARGELREKLVKLGFQGRIIDKPPIGKDWNDDLLQTRPKPLQQNPNNRQSLCDQPGTERGMEL